MTIRSHITQVMQNYFDATDRRTRESSTSLEAQLLNMAAVELEDLEQRITRENAQSFQTVPTNIDSQGVYFSGRVPDAFLTGPDQTTLNSVVGKVGTTVRTLTPYDDRLPVPSRIDVDGSNSVLLTTPLIFTLVGSGDSQAQIYTVQYVEPGDLPIPNRVTLWLDQLGLNQTVVTLTITGEIAPRPAWIAERRKTTEVVTLTAEGVSYTRNRWAVIDKIAVRGLPLGVRLRGWSMPFALPAAPDSARPYTTPQDRDVLFPRYWQISNPDNLLKEMYRADGFTGLEAVNTYSTPEDLVDVAVEPNTNGLFAVSQGTLYYADRREVLPTLADTGLAQEPLFGLQVVPDILKIGPVRYATLSGIPYANSANVFQYRYTVNGVSSILPSGALGPINAGWRSGSPEPVSFPLLATGDYVFRLEMQDASGSTTIDVVPYKNAAFNPVKVIDISALIDVVEGLAFDSYGQLWIWNGTFAIPINIFYDGYVFDADSKTVFTTEKYDSLQVA